jgi:hypothetical protein
MRQRGYAIVFGLVLLAACAGGFFGGRYLIRRLQQDFRPRTTWAPPTLSAPVGPEGRGPTVIRGTSVPRLIATPDATPSPSAASSLPGTASPAATSATFQMMLIAPESAPAATETVAFAPSPVPAFLFGLMRPVKHSAGDCPGNYILGQVVDRGGNPMSDVRLSLVDEYGNVETKATKSGVDAGRYDFPLFGPPRKFYLMVVDDRGRPLGPEIEIAHGLGAYAQATCHWVDWRRE